MIEQLKVQWYSYIKLAIIYAMVFQISFVFDFIWYDRTYTMLAYMLIISFFTHLFLIRMNKILTFFLEYLVAFLVCLIFSEKWELYAGQSMYTLYDKLQLTITDSWQFYTIGLIMLTLAHFIHYAIVSRAHFTTFFAVGLLLMLIVDSFSPIVLWQHVIAVVVVYLLWHMFWHYEKIRKENEDEFEVLINSPASIFTPVATVVSIAIVIALVMPYGPPLLEDPYALWKKSRGEEVPAFLGDKGFKSDRANVRSRQSGYSRSSTHLGGGFNFNYETVLEIFTPQKSYWRGETVNYYNGEGWIDTLQQDSFNEIGPKASFEQHRPLAQTEQIDIEVKLIREAPYPVLFHPSEPIMVNEVAYDLIDSSLAQLDSSHRYIEGPDQNIEQVIYDENINLPGVKRLEKDNTLAFDMNQAASSYPVAYSIKADVIKLEVDKLVQADAKLEDAALHELYTTLPNTLPQEVTELAALITSQASSDYERAKLLEEYLKLNYAYSNQPNEERLTGQADDFVYQFLFELYEGYCDYFSTAMAVMAKSLDMPARWVKGFSPGVNLSEQYLQQIQMPYDNYEQLQNSLNGGIFNVRNADAHSWVEIYFEGYGWIAFEPTPGFSYPYAYAGDDIQLTPLALDLDLDVEQQLISTKKQTAFNSVRLALIIFIIIGLAVLVWIKKDSIRDTIVSLRYKRFSNNERIVYQFTAFLRYCERRGLHREKTETVHEAILSWQHGSKAWKQQLSDCYQLFEKAKYSAQQMDDEHVQKVNELIQSLKKQWKL